MERSLFKFSENSPDLNLGVQKANQHTLDGKFIYDLELIKAKYLKHFDSVGNPESSFLSTTRESAVKALSLIQSAYPIMSDELPHVQKFFEAHISGIFYYRSRQSAGGSSDSLPGIIWACPRKNWLTIDALEFLIHECVHQLLFIDEESCAHYTEYALARMDTILCYSAIRGIPRPLPLVLHSICVGAEIVSSRHTSATLRASKGFVFHPNTSDLMISCQKSIREIKKNHFHHLTERGREILNYCDQTLAFFENEKIQSEQDAI